MRLVQLPTAAGAFALLFALTACGGDDTASLPGAVGGNGAQGAPQKREPGFKGLQKAGSMAGASRIVGAYTKCANVTAPREGKSEEDDPTYGKAFTVTERGKCNDGRTTILMIKDAKAFQAAYKADLDKKRAEHPRYRINIGPIVGQDFATGSEDSETMSAMLGPASGLRVLNCHPDFKPPSGYTKEPALVKGCVLTNYLSEN
ncbi:hypothetical protein ACWGDE_29200 [Streptomyces sp. NPDC054956]